ncbi:VOC family protein [Dyella sp. 2RAB6]|uniref:VOC family protein n=1 Tax=Dyella sp. 2RAB6 TaxID=3232992 RepID=UPI003F8DF52E
MIIQPYLHFEGRCEEAIEFYKQAVGATVEMLMRYRDSPEPPVTGCEPQGDYQEKIIHSSFRIGESVVNATDGFNSGQSSFKGFSLSLTVGSDAEANKRFDALAVGGQVTMPLSKTFFTSSFGMLTDKFGVNWMILTVPQ